MTYRERREARAARLEGWAGQRQASARATAEAIAADPRTHDIAFLTQPGRIPERDRMNRREAAAFESMDKADRMAARAAEIRRQADHAIYDDDPDAIPRLRERLAEMEARRAGMAAANAAHRKSHPELRAMTAYERSTAAPHPPYELSNLGGRISAARARLARLERAEAKRVRG